MNGVEEALRNREHTHYGIYSDVGTVLDRFTTYDLYCYFVNVLKCEGGLRNYLEQQITAAEIDRERRAV